MHGHKWPINSPRTRTLCFWMFSEASLWNPACRIRWRPDLSDSFDGTSLEGVTGGVLGRKWLFKQVRGHIIGHARNNMQVNLSHAWLQENESLWQLDGEGALRLRTDCQPGIESAFPANMLLQRPTSAYRLFPTMRVELIGLFHSCMTEIYLHIDAWPIISARTRTYLCTYTYQGRCSIISCDIPSFNAGGELEVAATQSFVG